MYKKNQISVILTKKISCVGFWKRQQKYVTERDEPESRAYCLRAAAGKFRWKPPRQKIRLQKLQDRKPPAQDYGAEKKGYSENGRELA